MKTTIDTTGKSITVWIEGSVDSVTAPSLHRELSGVTAEDAEDVTVDLSKTHYISSAGLRELLILQKRLSKGRLRVKNAGADIREILHVTGFSHILDIVDSRHDEKDYSIFSFKDLLSQKVSHYRDVTILDDGSVSWTWEDLDADRSGTGSCAIPE